MVARVSWAVKPRSLLGTARHSGVPLGSGSQVGVCLYDIQPLPVLTLCRSPGAVLAVLFLRGVGVVGHDTVEINSSTTPEEKSGLDDVGDPDKGQFHAVDEEALHERSSV
jgi:hypothetical protein